MTSGDDIPSPDLGRAAPANEAVGEADEAPRVLPIVQEVASVHKQWIDQGGYRLSKRVETLQETIDEVLRRADVRIERVPIGRMLEDGVVPDVRHEGNTFVLPVVEEILVTEKRLVLREEVRVTRVETTTRSPQQVSLRREDILIERLGEGESLGADPHPPAAVQVADTTPRGGNSKE